MPVVLFFVMLGMALAHFLSPHRAIGQSVVPSNHAVMGRHTVIDLPVMIPRMPVVISPTHIIKIHIGRYRVHLHRGWRWGFRLYYNWRAAGQGHTTQ